MTPERRQRIEQVYRVALERDAERRASFLATACAGDDELRREVEALLASNQSNPISPISFETVISQEDKETTEHEPSLIGREIGHYRVISSLGVGGMGEVWLAEDLTLGRKVAIKILPARLTASANRVRRFELEARAASALNHPNIVTIYELGGADLGRFIVMEMVGGRTLREVIEDAPKLGEAIDVGAQTALALGVAHAAGIIHRDIKPENIMVRGDGLVKLLDFGIARLTLAGQENSGVGTTARTGTGKLLGTVQYMSPEQACSEAVTSATDLFSLGIVLYELITGKHPFEAETKTGTQLAIITQPALAPSQINPEISPELDALILQMLEKEPHLRPMAEEVERVLGKMGDGGWETGDGVKREPGNQKVISGASPSSISYLPSPTLHTVGREKERAELRAGFDSTLGGRGLLMCVAGEPGLGKTTIVEQFLRELRESGAGCRIVRGRCSERLAGTEAYLPWLEALDNLIRGSESAARALKQLAPSWYAQLAPLAVSRLEVSRGDALAASQERMKRELSGFLRETSRREPLVLYFDDLHWADVSTIDLLGFIANRFDGVRLLLIVTYRPSDLLLVKHPFLQIKPDLQAHGVCRELTLEFLNQVEIENYLELEFPLHRFPPEFPKLIHAKTEGNPLFMADLVRYLRDQKVIAEEGGEWKLARSVPEIERELPESVRGMIERKIAQLSDQDRQLLVAASVQGAQFDSAVAAKVMGLDEAEVEDRLDALERVYAFVQLTGERELPDRTLTLRYRFVHVFYQNALFGSLRATRKVQLSRAVAQALIDCYGERSREVASELASLWATAREYGRSAECYRIAAQNAVQVFASQEAAALARRGLAALEPLTESKEKDEHELSLQIALGNILIATRGYASTEVEQVYSRARQLCERLGDEAHLLPVLYGLYVNHLARARYRQALDFGEEFLALAQRRQDTTVIVGYRAVGVPLFFMGRLAEAREMFAAGLASYDAAQHRPLTWTYGAEPGAVIHLYLAWTLWLMGYPDQALNHSREAARLAREVSHAQSQAQALSGSALLHQYRREPQPARELAEAAIKFSAEQGLALWLSWGAVLSGWAMTELGETDAGIARLRQGLEASALTGSGMWQTYLQCLLAEVLGKAHKPDEARTILDAVPELMETSGERFWEAEMYRMRGALLLDCGLRIGDGGLQTDESGLSSNPQSPILNPPSEAEACFLQAVEIGQRQGAKLLELRAAISLAQLRREPDTLQRLTEIHGWFTEGFETPDLQQARTMLFVDEE